MEGEEIERGHLEGEEIKGGYLEGEEIVGGHSGEVRRFRWVVMAKS